MPEASPKALSRCTPAFFAKSSFGERDAVSTSAQSMGSYRLSVQRFVKNPSMTGQRDNRLFRGKQVEIGGVGVAGRIMVRRNPVKTQRPFLLGLRKCLIYIYIWVI